MVERARLAGSRPRAAAWNAETGTNSGAQPPRAHATANSVRACVASKGPCYETVSQRARRWLCVSGDASIFVHAAPLETVVSSPCLHASRFREPHVSNPGRVRAFSSSHGQSLFRGMLKCVRKVLVGCCGRRKAACAVTGEQAAVTADYFTTSGVARDNAVEAAMNAASAAQRAAIAAQHHASGAVRHRADDEQDTTSAELRRAKSI